MSSPESPPPLEEVPSGSEVSEVSINVSGGGGSRSPPAGGLNRHSSGRHSSRSRGNVPLKTTDTPTTSFFDFVFKRFPSVAEVAGVDSRSGATDFTRKRTSRRSPPSNHFSTNLHSSDRRQGSEVTSMGFKDPRYRLEALILNVLFGPYGFHLIYLRRHGVGICYLINALLILGATLGAIVPGRMVHAAGSSSGYYKYSFSDGGYIIFLVVLAALYLLSWRDLLNLSEFLTIANSASTSSVPMLKWDVMRVYLSPVGIFGAHHYIMGHPLRGLAYTFTFGGLGVVWISEYFTVLRHWTDESLAYRPLLLRDRRVAWLLYFLFGGINLHHFYLRRYRYWFLMTLNTFMVLSIIVPVVVAKTSDNDPGIAFMFLFLVFIIIPLIVDSKRLNDLVHAANITIELENKCEASSHGSEKPASDTTPLLATGADVESTVLINASNSQTDSAIYIETAQKKSRVDTWLLWGTPFGIMGGHLYYLGLNTRGFFYTLSAGFGTILWFIDIFRLNRLIDAANSEIEERLQVVRDFQQLEVFDDGIDSSSPSAGLESLTIIDSSRLLLGERVGVGGSAEVFRGSWNGTEVAIKRLRFGFAELDDTAQKDFKTECRMMSELRHPNILQFLGICLYPDICVVTELMKASLYDVLHEPSIDLPWKVRISIAVQASKGMNYLHCHQPRPIIHRDLKSPNLLVGDHFLTKVCDFGLSRVQDNLSKSMTTVGTTCWMAPELLKNDHRYSEKVDVYSMGIVLWEIATRLDPYIGITPIQVITKLLTEDIRPDLKSIPEECPRELEELMCLCWATNPSDRPSFGEIITQLDSIATNLNTSS